MMTAVEIVNAQITDAATKLGKAAQDMQDMLPGEVMGFDLFVDFWKSPEIDAVMNAGRDMMEGSMAMFGQAMEQAVSQTFDPDYGPSFVPFLDGFADQADNLAEAGSRAMTRFEDAMRAGQESVGASWQTSARLLEQGEAWGAEMAAWTRREIEAGNDDLAELAAIETITELPQVQTRIFLRHLESGMAETARMGEWMFGAVNDSLQIFGRFVSPPR